MINPRGATREQIKNHSEKSLKELKCYIWKYWLNAKESDKGEQGIKTRRHIKNKK